jgi:hypothetical protein
LDTSLKAQKGEVFQPSTDGKTIVSWFAPSYTLSKQIRITSDEGKTWQNLPGQLHTQERQERSKGSAMLKRGKSDQDDVFNHAGKSLNGMQVIST